MRFVVFFCLSSFTLGHSALGKGEVSILTEVDGIEIPRLPQKLASMGNETKAKTSAPKYGGKATFSFNGGPKSLKFTDNTAHRDMAGSLFEENLVVQDPETLEFQPALAESWTVEGNVVTFRLRPGLKWHDGTSFTTKDLELSCLLLKNPHSATEGAFSGFFESVKECKAIDELHFRIVGKEPNYLFLKGTSQLSRIGPGFERIRNLLRNQRGYDLTLEPLTPAEEVARKTLSASGQAFGTFYSKQDEFNISPSALGPYQVKSADIHDKVVFIRNPHYWNAGGKPYLDEITLHFAVDPASLTTAAQAKITDGILGASISQWRNQSKLKDFVALANPSSILMWIQWNTENPILQDVRVRLALSLLCDKVAMSKFIYDGTAVPISGPDLSNPGYDHEVKALDFAPEIARDLLIEAGWFDTNNDGILDKKGQKFALRILTRADRGSQLEPYQKELKKIGITLEIQTLDFATMLSKQKNKNRNDFEGTYAGYSFYPEEDLFGLFHSSQIGIENNTRVNDKTMDTLLEQHRKELHPEKRMALRKQIHRQFDRLQPATIFSGLSSYILLSDRIGWKKINRTFPELNLREVWIK